MSFDLCALARSLPASSVFGSAHCLTKNFPAGRKKEEVRYRFRRDKDKPLSKFHIQNAKEQLMAKCEVCGNNYDKSFSIEMSGQKHVFDSFECAIQKLAPECSHCQCRIIGHGVEGDGRIYCCANCARQEGIRAVADRAV
jgi:hypothetical protein